jgi:hypothetical protein
VPGLSLARTLKIPHFVIPAPAFKRVNSSGNPEDLERTGFRVKHGMTKQGRIDF